MQNIKTIEDLDFSGRRTFVRVDFNVPLESGKVTDDTRIRAALPTIEKIRAAGGRLVVASHLGRPKGKPDPAFSVEPAAARLAELIGGDVRLTDDCIGDGARKVAADLRDGDVAMLENLRFHKGEEANDAGFAAELRKLCDLYVNDAFGCAHRAHASVDALPRMTRERCMGLLMAKEVRSLGRLLGGVEKPFVAVIGGAKVSDKIGILTNLLGRVDAFVIGGAMANTFLAARGGAMGKSRVETDKLTVAKEFLIKAEASGATVMLPEDLVAAASPDATETQVVRAGSVPADAAAYDIGPKTVAAFRERIATAGTVFWNGPMGMFEKAPFAAGTMAIAKAMAGSAAFTVAGGGDSVSALSAAGLAKMLGHVSTGGGASLEMIEGRVLPGLAALEE